MENDTRIKETQEQIRYLKNDILMCRKRILDLDLKKHIMSKSPKYEELRKQIEQDEKEIDRLELILT